MSSERRKHARVQESFPAKCRRAGAQEQWQDIKVVNLSADGLRCLSTLPYEPQMDLDFQMILPLTEELLEIAGTVAWMRAPAAGLAELGVRLRPVSEAQEAQIDQIVDFMRRGPRSLGPPSAPPA